MLTLLGGLAASAFLLAGAERRIGAGAVAEVQAGGAAEGALAVASAGWPPALTPRAPGEETALAVFAGASGYAGAARVRALGGPVFAIRADGSAPGFAQSVTRVSIELLVRLDSAGGDTLVRPRAIARAWSRIFP